MPARFSFIGLVVQDMARSLHFYRELGFNIPDGMDGEKHTEIQVRDGLTFAWDTVPVIQSFAPDWAPPVGSHRVSIDFVCDTPAEVDTLYAYMASLGDYGFVPPFDALWDQRFAVLHDPDGNAVSLYAALG